jgi:hypothetical protein
MTPADLDSLIDASAAVLGLTIAPAWREPVRANLAISLRMGALVLDFPLPDEAEPALVFSA